MMTTNPFAAPATASGINWEDLNGSLLLIEPIAEEQDIPTVHGPANAIRANVIPLDGDQAGTTYNDTLVFPKVLSSQLRPKLGQKVLGRLGQGQKKPGQSAPWILAEASPADVETGMAHLNKSMQAAPAAEATQTAPAAATTLPNTETPATASAPPF